MPTGTSIQSQQIIPELFDEAVQAAFQNKNAFLGSGLASTKVAIIKGTMPDSGPDVIGNQISVPYFELMGDFQDLGTDGSAITPQAIGMTKEQSTIKRAGLAFQITTWARMNPLGDVYQEAARQIVMAGQRRMDKALIDAATDTATFSQGLLLDKFNATNPHLLDYDLMIDAKMQWRDWQDDIAALVVHSKTFANLLKLKDALGRPLISPDSVKDGLLPNFAGVPVVVSDRMPITGSTMGSVTSAGTSPPVITLSGVPDTAIDLKIVCIVGGALGTWTLKWSLDNGNSYVQDGNFNPFVTSAATINLTDATGRQIGTVVINIATGTATNDNVWTASSINKHTSLICKKGALVFWYNASAMSLRTLPQPLSDSDIAALWMYFVGYRYKRLRGTPLPGIVQIRHN